MHLYEELAPYFHLVTAPVEYVGEAAAYATAIERGARRTVRTLLELGAGGGNNASHLKAHYACVLTDLSAAMLEQSRRLNPECDHEQGDMRTLRLGCAFDAILVHDAVVYMTTLEDLERAIATAFVHCAPGGVAIFAPDYVRETFRPGTSHGGNDEGARGARYLEWVHDPDSGDATYVVDYAFLLRDGVAVRAVHDRHVEGMFPRATWVDLLSRAGFKVEFATGPLDDGATSEFFVAVRPR